MLFNLNHKLLSFLSILYWSLDINKKTIYAFINQHIACSIYGAIYLTKIVCDSPDFRYRKQDISQMDYQHYAYSKMSPQSKKQFERLSVWWNQK